jgi:hypothetical protein
MRFINRTQELKAIREKLRSKKFELYIIYGRRRIGKTALSLESVRGRDFIYYLATEEDNIKKFKDIGAKSISELKYVEQDWEAIFNFLKDRIIIIDEFPNLIKEDPKIVSIFQRIIDTILKKSQTKLIFLGSSISMMEDKVLSYRAPLYGRKTGQIKLKPLRFSEIKKFFPKATKEELVEIYGFCDGIPFYLEKVNYPFWKWLNEELKRPDTFLKTEIDFLMKYEFKEVRTYKKILEAIALGNTKLGEIKNYIQAKGTDITPYLRNLMEVEFIEKRSPILSSLKSRKGRYYIKDNFLNFWFRFIYPNLTFIEEGIFQSKEIRKDYNHYLGLIFEKICKKFLIEKKDLLPFEFTKIGSQWGKTFQGDQYEIDIIIFDEGGKKAGFFECKWKKIDERMARNLLVKLQKKSKFIKVNFEKKFFGLIAKEIKGKKKLRKENFLVFDLEDF